MFQVGEGGIVAPLELFDVLHANLASVEANRPEHRRCAVFLAWVNGAFWESYPPVFANWRFLQIRQSIFVYSFKDYEKRKKNIDMEYNSCYILYIEL